MKLKYKVRKELNNNSTFVPSVLLCGLIKETVHAHGHRLLATRPSCLSELLRFTAAIVLGSPMFSRNN